MRRVWSGNDAAKNNNITINLCTLHLQRFKLTFTVQNRDGYLSLLETKRRWVWILINNDVTAVTEHEVTVLVVNTTRVPAGVVHSEMQVIRRLRFQK